MQQLSRLLIAFLGLTIISCDAFAVCSDGRHPSVAQEYKLSDFVGVGVVIAKKDFSFPDDPQGVEKTVYRIKISKRLKGAMSSPITITSDNTSSRFPMNTGKSYLVFLRVFGDETVVDSCGNSGELKNRKVELAKLTKLAHR